MHAAILNPLQLACGLLLATTSLALPFQRTHNVRPSKLSARQSEDALDEGIETIISDSPLLTLHRDLVEIDSITGNEGDIGTWLSTFLEEHDFNVTLQQVPTEDNPDAERWNIYATRDPSVDPRVILTTHLDVVAPVLSPRYSATYSNDSDDRANIIVQGRGAVDAKAPVAAQTFAALELLESNDTDISPGDIALLFVVNEEDGGEGMAFFNQSNLYRDSIYSTIEGFIFGEPTEGKLATGHKGSASLVLSANGTTAHSAYPENGVSAVNLILPALVAVNQLDALTPDQGGLPTSEKYGKSTLNVGVVNAGTASNVVPGYAEARASIRVAGGEASEFEDAIKAHVALLGTDPDVDIKFTWNNPPVELEGEVEGFEREVMNYGTDITRLEYREDVKMYLYGPGSIEVAHGVDEALKLGELEEAVEGYKRLVLDVLGGSE